MSLIEWGAAFAMGAMGSTHCAAMCGPLSNVLGSGAHGDALGGAEKRRLPLADAPLRGRSGRAAVQAGRLTTYAALGAIAGALGTGVRHLPGFASAQLGVRVAAAVLLVATGLYVAGLFRRFARLERALAPLQGALSRALRRMRATGLAGRYVAGLAWGLLPCGLLWAGLGLAVVAASAPVGAGIMIAFGFGTLPSLLAVELFAVTFQRIIRHVWLRRAGGALIAISGVVQADLAVEYARSIGRANEAPCCAARHHAPR